MIQKQISLPEELDQKIQERAKLLKESEERVIRELIEQGLQAPKPWKNAGEALSSLSELGIRGPKDLAINHDKYLYEDE
jgi:predicted DNA-binding protein